MNIYTKWIFQCHSFAWNWASYRLFQDSVITLRGERGKAALYLPALCTDRQRLHAAAHSSTCNTNWTTATLSLLLSTYLGQGQVCISQNASLHSWIFFFSDNKLANIWAEKNLILKRFDVFVDEIMNLCICFQKEYWLSFSYSIINFIVANPSSSQCSLSKAATVLLNAHRIPCHRITLFKNVLV